MVPVGTYIYVPFDNILSVAAVCSFVYIHGFVYSTVLWDVYSVPDGTQCNS